MAVIRVLEEDPELGEVLAAEERARAEEAAVARVEAVAASSPRGAVDLDRFSEGYGMLVLDGILARRVTLGQFECTELLGQGDLLRPWTFQTASTASIPSGVTWNVVAPVRMAALDRRFAVAVAQWPEVSATL